jgi:4-hydroxybenzoate polyprenyltransferase
MIGLYAWFKIVRPPILFISSLGAIVGALNTSLYLNAGSIKLSYFQIIMTLIGSVFLAAGLMVHNDATDIKSDRTNRPRKPIPSGLIMEKTAYKVGLSFMILAILISMFINYNEEGNPINWNCGLFTLMIMIVGLYYNHYGKYHGIIGHVTVALGVGAIPYWGSIAVYPENYLVMAPLSIAIFIQEIGREIMVNAGDFTGDLKAGFKTLPVILGRRGSMKVALIFYLLFIPIYPLPAYDWLNLRIANIFGELYLLGGTLLAITLIVTWILTYKVVLKNDEKKIWRAFELYERWGTRIMIIIFQLFLLLEVFY